MSASNPPTAKSNPLSSRLRRCLSPVKQLAHAGLCRVHRFAARPVALFFGEPATAICRMQDLTDFSAERVLGGYAQGLFATGEPNGRIMWHSPKSRGVIATDRVHVSKRLKTYLNKSTFEIHYNRDFAGVMQRCAARQKTWITQPIVEAFCQLHHMGTAHSVEAYLNDRLVGGGYGVALGKTFFLESMFCSENHASKIAFLHLAEKLRRDGFTEIDCQFLTGHWKSFGAREVDREDFQKLVARSLHQPAQFSKSNTPAKAGLPVVVIGGGLPANALS